MKWSMQFANTVEKAPPTRSQWTLPKLISRNKSALKNWQNLCYFFLRIQTLINWQNLCYFFADPTVGKKIAFKGQSSGQLSFFQFLFFVMKNRALPTFNLGRASVVLSSSCFAFPCKCSRWLLKC